MKPAHVAAMILAAGAFHDLSWQFVDYELQGNWRALTQWFPLLILSIAAGRAWHDRFVSAACIAVAIMGSTTTLCSAAWFAVRWDTRAWSCSREFSNAMVMLSALVAAMALIWMPRGR